MLAILQVIQPLPFTESRAPSQCQGETSASSTIAQLTIAPKDILQKVCAKCTIVEIDFMVIQIQ